jgi:hypothetical protein
MGGRVTPGMSVGRGAERGGAPPRSLRERFGALRNLPPFLKLIWGTSRGLTAADLACRLARAFLPVATLFVGKLIIDEVVRLAGAGHAPGSLRAWLASGLVDTLLALLGVELALAVLSDVLGRIVSLLDALLSERFSNTTSVRLMAHAATLDLEDFEDSELQDRLDRARRQTMGRSTLMSQVFGQAQDMVTIASFGAGLLAYAPWLIALLVLALVPAFLGEAHFNAQSYSLDYAWTPERRELDYVRQTGASVETAKEVKIFGLNAFLIERSGRWRRPSTPPTEAWRPAARDGAGCSPPSERSATTWPTRSSRGAPCVATSRSVTSRSCPDPSAGSATCSKGSSSASRRWRARPSTSTTYSRSSRSGPRSCRPRIRGQCRSPSARGSRSRTWASATRGRSAGRCAT